MQSHFKVRLNYRKDPTKATSIDITTKAKHKFSEALTERTLGPALTDIDPVSPPAPSPPSPSRLPSALAFSDTSDDDDEPSVPESVVVSRPRRSSLGLVPDSSSLPLSEGNLRKRRKLSEPPENTQSENQTKPTDRSSSSLLFPPTLLPQRSRSTVENFRSVFVDLKCGILKEETLKLSSKSTEEFILSPGPISIMLDGSIQGDYFLEKSPRKLVGVSVRTPHSRHYLTVVDVKRCHGPTWCNQLLESVAKDLQGYKFPLVGVFCDNQLPPPSMMSFSSHIIEISCSPQSLINSIDEVLSKSPFLSILEDVKTFCIAVHSGNSSPTEIAFRTLQHSPSPLHLLIPTKNRKWSGGFLMLERVLQLKDVLDALRKEDKSLPSFSWEKVVKAHSFLSEIYALEKTLLEDREGYSTNLMHYAHCWRRFLGHIEKHFEPDTMLSVMDFLAKYDQESRLCGVLNLAMALWPDPSASLTGHSELNQLRKESHEELRELIPKQWAIYKQFPKEFNFPLEYLDYDDDELARASFTMKACAQLERHWWQEFPFRKSQEVFRLEKCSPSTYWDSVACRAPELRVIVRVLEACSAPEPVFERMFMTEGWTHSSFDIVHQGLSWDYVEARLKIKANYMTEKRGQVVVEELGKGGEN